MQARKHARFAVQLPVSFHSEKLSNDGTILNLSQEGCAIASKTVAEPQTYLHLTMRLREGEDPICVDLAAVRWRASGRFGVEFIKLTSGAGERLKQFVKLLESAV